MRGTIPLKVGRFRFDADATLDIETHDGGHTLIFRDDLSNHMWAALIDEFGRVINPVIRRGRTPKPFTAVPPAKGEPLKFHRPKEPLPEPVRRTKKPATKLWLVIQYGPNRNPKQVVRILGGFAGPKGSFVLYRSCVGNRIVYEGQLFFDIDGRATTRECIPAQFRLPDDRWDEVLSLTEHDKFEFGGSKWRRYSLAELKVFKHAQRFQLSYGEQPSSPS